MRGYNPESSKQCSSGANPMILPVTILSQHFQVFFTQDDRSQSVLPVQLYSILFNIR